jgi:STE24 endopeptidase
MGDELKALGVTLVLGGIAVILLFAIVRKLPRTWWIWGSIASLALMVVMVAISPVYLQPIFNKVTRLNDPKITVPILHMAHANGIPTNDVYQMDASRQTTRMSANVSGFANTMRITINDNLLRRGSPEEVQAVMGHEMGHYVMNHIPKSMIFLLIVIVAFFAFLRWALDWTLARWGTRWQIRGVGDPAVLPLVLLLAGIFFFVLTPVMNTETRTQEKEADMFGLNAARQPDGFARQRFTSRSTARCDPARWKSGSSSTTPAATTASTPPWCGRAKIWNCLRRHRRSPQCIESGDSSGLKTDAKLAL